MKRFILSTLVCFVFIASIAQSINGRVIDEQAQPMAFVNVVLLNRSDSTFVTGEVTKADGTFFIETDRKDGLLKVSSVGYETKYIDARQGNAGDIVMLSNIQELGEVEVNAIKPTHKLTTEGIMTTVEHTLLSKAGTANDVLQNLPGVQKKQDGIEVFGKGTPIIYKWATNAKQGRT